MPISLVDLVQEAVNEMEVLVREKNLQLIYKKSSSPQVLGERDKLKRVVVNLLDNALKFTPAGGQIEVSVGEEGNMAMFQVADTGIGIGPKDLDHIFNRFYRVAKDDSLPGSGLGLSIVKAIIEAHRGKIEVRSKPGEGSVFTVYLPLARSNY
jgi:Signal transduction histidine kinase